MRVQAIAPGFYNNIYRNIGDVFDVIEGGWTADSAQITADSSITVDSPTLVASSAVSAVPVGNAVYPLPGWMTPVAANTPLTDYTLSNQGASSQVQASKGVNTGAQKVIGNQRRYVV